MKKILHVSDNFGGGLVTAVQGYVAERAAAPALSLGRAPRGLP